MKYIFWQNIISIHQSSFLEALAVNNKVLLIVEEEIESKRKLHGWSVPKIKNVEIIINPNEIKIERILRENKNEFHFYSGIEIYPVASAALKKAIIYKMPNIGVLLEPFNLSGFKGGGRKIKFRFLIKKYKRHIRVLLPTGDLGRKCYEDIGFFKNKIFDWGYFTNAIDKIDDVKDPQRRNKSDLLFVGSIDRRKNILEIVKILKSNSFEFNKFFIAGCGELESELKNSISGHDNIVFLGGLKNEEIKGLMNKCDILILPSLFDGWGAVVNEALQAGMQVIASGNCGASILLDGEQRGEVFSFKKDNFDQVLKKWIAKGPLKERKRQEIANWSATHISGEVAADYFISVVDYSLGKEKKRPVAPWLLGK